MDQKEKASILAVTANFVLAIGKVFVGLTTGITSVLADGINSASDIFASTISFVGIKMGNKPEDEGHPYSHHKFEVFSGLIITIILLLTGLWIVLQSIQTMVNPKTFDSINYIAFGVMVFSAIVNFVMSKYKIKVGKEENSISLISDGVHSGIDVYTSLIVLVSVTVSFIFPLADGIVSAIIGVYIIKEAFSLGKEASDSLLDGSADEETEEKIRKIVKEQGIKLSELKTQKKGAKINANLEISLPKNIFVEKATQNTRKLREKLFSEMKELNHVSLQIKDRDYSENYFSQGIGEGISWTKSLEKGPGGYCVCKNCNYRVKHKSGVPCSSLKCPECEGNMKREFSRPQ